MKTFPIAVLLLVAGPVIGQAQVSLARVPADRSGSSGWFVGVESGVAMYQNAHLNRFSAAVRLGHRLDRNGVVRAAVVVNGTSADEPSLGIAGSLELRPLSPRRVTPILAAGGGQMFTLFEYPGHQGGFGFLGAGLAVRATGGLHLTLRATVADGYSSSKLYSMHVGVELGR